jgi:hypothetical protein
MRAFTLCVVLWAVMMFVSCADPTPAEIGVNCKLDGRGKGCAMVLLNDKGVQLQVVPTDFAGIGYFKQVKPGSYTIKFQSADKQFYPAVKTVTVAGGDSAVVNVELNEAPTDAPPAE